MYLKQRKRNIRIRKANAANIYLTHTNTQSIKKIRIKIFFVQVEFKAKSVSEI